MTGFCPYKKGSLKESECHHDGYCSECPHNTKDDTISRQAVLALARDLTFEGIDELKYYKYRCIDPNDVQELPSAQPVDKDINVPINDTISRQAAIDALKVAYWDKKIQSAKDDPCVVDAMTDWAIRQIKALPSAQPEHIRCGECKHRDKRYLCNVWDYYVTNDDFYCGSAKRREE